MCTRRHCILKDRERYYATSAYTLTWVRSSRIYMMIPFHLQSLGGNYMYLKLHENNEWTICCDYLKINLLCSYPSRTVIPVCSMCSFWARPFLKLLWSLDINWHQTCHFISYQYTFTDIKTLVKLHLFHWVVGKFVRTCMIVLWNGSLADEYKCCILSVTCGAK